MEWDQHYADERGCRWWPNEELVRALSRAGRRFGRALEVGCGNGSNLGLLLPHAAVVEGVDVSPAALALASRRYGSQNPQLSLACAQAYGPGGHLRRAPAASYDLVVDCMTSQHLRWRDHLPAYLDYLRALAPGGLLFLYHLDVTGAGAIRGGYLGDFDWERYEPFERVPMFCLPPPELLAAAVAAAGFAVKERRGLAVERFDARAALPSVVTHYTVIAAEAP